MARRQLRASTQDRITDAWQKKATAFRKKATSLATKAKAKLGDRDMGTRRKFDQAMSAREEGLRLVRIQAVLTSLANGLEANTLEYPLTTLTKAPQVEDLVNIASRFELDCETIRQRDWQCKAQWTSEEVIADCNRPDSTIGELYTTLGLASSNEMVMLVQQLHRLIEDSGCIDWNAEELLRLRGEVGLKKIPGFVPTPPELADELLDWLCLDESDRFLDPAAGDGAILERVRRQYPALKRIQCCEINSDLNQILRLAGFEPECRDYFDWHPSDDERPNKIGANPPFERLEDIDFVYKMWEDLAPGGRLAAIMSASYSFSSKKKAKEFRAWLETVPVILDQENARDAFKPSGYSILTRLLVLQKPE